jgi:hypothetical protein
MKPQIYYGNIQSNVFALPTLRPLSEITNSTIIFTGFDLSAGVSSETRLDLLFYNRVNEIGEVLSSLVYISNPLDLDDIDGNGDQAQKTYDVKKLYANTDTELALRITQSITDYTYLNCKWTTSKFFTSSISPLADDRHEPLAVNGYPSVKLETYGVSFDGWYTQMSIALREITNESPPATVPVQKGLLALHDFAAFGKIPAILLVDSPADITLDSVWSPITTFLTTGTTNPDGSILVPGVSLGSVIISSSFDNPYIKQDLFVLPTYLGLYDSAVVQYAEYPVFGNPFPVLRDKHRIMHNYAIDNDFLEAQFILQTTEYFRAVAK